MTIAVVTGVGGINLNDGAKYKLMDFDLGDTVFEEAWIENWWSTDAILSNRIARKTKMKLVLRVRGVNSGADSNPTFAKLITNVEAVRNEFAAQNNSLTYTINGTARVVNTYQSPIDPIDYMGLPGHLIQRDNHVLRWEFELWRKPYLQGQTREAVI